jgi:aminoglycoside 3-N-acetyltransferase
MSCQHETPAYDPDMTPTRGMGATVNCFRSQRDALRSNHPSDSFVARGPAAARIVENHALASSLGEESPLARLYDLHASIFLLGVGYESNTSFHLAEYRSNWPSKRFVAGEHRSSSMGKGAGNATRTWIWNPRTL